MMKISKNMFGGLLTMIMVFCFCNLLTAESTKIKSDAEVLKMVEKVDDLYRSSSSKASMEMEIVTPHWTRTLKMTAWSKGQEHMFVRILAPKKEKGVATLKKGAEMWNYLPKTNKIMKIPPSMMMGSWMGSDFTNDDLVKEFMLSKDYSFKDVTPEITDPQPGVTYVKCIPREDLPIVWGSIVVAVQDKDYIPVWQKYYDEKGKLIREMTFKDVKDFNGRRIPTLMELTPTHKKGHKTLVRYLEAEFDINVDEDVFSMRHLRLGI